LSETKRKLIEIYGYHDIRDIENPDEDIFEKLERQREKELIADLRRAQLERIKAEEEARKMEALSKLSQANPSPNVNPNVSWLQSLMLSAGVDPQKTAEFIKNLGEEGARNLAMILSANPNNPATFLQWVKNPSTSAEDMVKLVNLIIETGQKLMPQQQSQQSLFQPISITDLIEKLKASVSQPQPTADQALKEEIKELRQELREMRERLHEKEIEALKAHFDARLKEIESKWGSLASMDKETQKMWFDLMKEKQKFDWEMEKEEKKARLEEKKTKQLFAYLGSLMGEGKPLAKLIDSAAERAALKVKGTQSVGGMTPSPTLKASTNEMLVVCPECGGQFTVPIGTTHTTCPYCKKDLVSKEYLEKAKEKEQG